MLTIENMQFAYNGNVVLKDLSFKIPQGKIVGLVGPNGAGKTTILKAALNLIPISKGRIIFNGEDITTLAAYKRVKKGISLTFQLVKIFPQMRVLDNVLIGLPEDECDGFFQGLVQSRHMKEQEKLKSEKGLELLKKVGLEHKADAWAGTLSFGQKRRLDIARLLALEPALLLLDEPASGLDYKAIEDILEVIKRIKEAGRTILLVEHNIDAVRSICDEVIVLNEGKIIAQGRPDEVLELPTVVECYLGC